DEVRAAIATSICDGHPKIGATARRFGLSVRTFQRRLDEHRVVFKDLVESVRRDLSLRYVADGSMRLTDVAFLVGYSELSAFGRAFRRWTGPTPLTMGKALRARAAVQGEAGAWIPRASRARRDACRSRTGSSSRRPTSWTISTPRSCAGSSWSGRDHSSGSSERRSRT